MKSTMKSRGWVCSVVFMILLSLSGTNVQARSGARTVPSSLSFGSINVNSFSSPQGSTVMNTGTHGITIAAVVSSSSQFSISGPALPLILHAGQGASFQVVFGPTSSGIFSGAIHIQFTRFADNVSTIPLSGTGLPQSPTNPLTLTTAASLPAGSVGTAYTTTLQASGGTTPYSWSFGSGALPAGLTLAAASGVISGTPTTAGTFSFTAKVTDSTSPTAQTATQAFSITVAAAVTPVQITASSVPSGQAGTAYTTTLAASGGTTPYSWSISSGALPAGLTLAAASGVISGTPTTAGTFSFTAKVTDSTAPTAQTATRSLSITVAAAVTPVQITTSSVAAGQVGVVYSTMIEASGGTTPYSWSISSGALPAGLTLAAASGTISGTPTTAGSFSFTAKVTDSTAPTAQTATQSFSITVAAGSAHSVLLNWTASPSSGVAGYNVYRSTVSGGGYAKINSSAVGGLTYTDAAVVNGQTYYYVTTSVDASGDESTYSQEVQMVVP